MCVGADACCIQSTRLFVDDLSVQAFNETDAFWRLRGNRPELARSLPALNCRPSVVATAITAATIFVVAREEIFVVFSGDHSPFRARPGDVERRQRP
jgi:hypothetical protein